MKFSKKIGRDEERAKATMIRVTTERKRKTTAVRKERRETVAVVERKRLEREREIL
jgi:hypothetical protein